VAVRADDRGPSYGDELRLRAAAGTSDGSALTVAEAEARLVVSQRTQGLWVGVGPTYLHWLGPTAITLSCAPALGVETFDRTLFASAGLHGGLGLGVVLSDAESERFPHGWLPWPEPGMPQPRYLAITRRRTLLTLELTGGADARASGASLAAGLLIGLAWSDERYTREAPPLPAWHLAPLRLR
jgi:hypothetical protein